MSVPSKLAELAKDNPVLPLLRVNNSWSLVTIPSIWTAALGVPGARCTGTPSLLYSNMGTAGTLYIRCVSGLPLTPAQTSEIIANVSAFIAEQRNMYASIARPLEEAERAHLAAHFPAGILDRARLARVKHLQNPPFYADLEHMGFRNLPQFRRMAAVTFVDVIVSQQEFTPPLVFHELVHVVQYQELGLQKFAELYVRGFLETGEYLSIPLERVAYHLEGLFRLRPDLKIEVEKQATSF